MGNIVKGSIKTVGVFLASMISIIFLGVNELRADDVMKQEFNSPRVIYWMQFNSNNMHCQFLVNEMSAHSTIINGARELYSVGFDIEGRFDRGVNSLKLRGVEMPEEDQNPNTGEPYCNVSLIAFVTDPITGEEQSKEVSNLRLTFDKDGSFTSEESAVYPDKSVTSEPILTILDRKQFEGVKNNNVMLERELVINHALPPYRWMTESTPFEDTPENRELLWQEYDEYRKLIEAGDMEGLKKKFQTALDITKVIRPNLDIDSYFEIISGQLRLDIFNKKRGEVKLTSFNREDYQLEIYNEGKLFRFVNKKQYEEILYPYSPIIYEDSNSYLNYTPTFTLVNGKIELAFI